MRHDLHGGLFELAYTGGLLAGSANMPLGGCVSFAILFGAAGGVRFSAARTTQVSMAVRRTGAKVASPA